MSAIEARAEMLIRRPAAEVFAAFVDPAVTTRIWFTKSSGRLEPGKRPFQTIIPAFLTKDGQPLAAFGLMGGDMQPQGHAQVVVNLVDFGMNLQEAGDAIRFHHTGSSEPTGTVMKDGGTLFLGEGLPEPVLQELMRRGHRIGREPVGAYGGYQAIGRDPANGFYLGATEKRKDGAAAGF